MNVMLKNYIGRKIRYDRKMANQSLHEQFTALGNLFVQVPCPICWQPVVHTIVYTDAGKLGHCTSCGMIYSHIRMSDEALKVYYSRFVPGFLINSDIWKEDLVRRPLLNNMDLDVIEQYAHKGEILDIGACAGDFLCYARERGWKVNAQELSQDCVAVLKQIRIPVERSFIHEVVYEPERFDVISLRHTLEHTPRLRTDMILLNRALADDGILYIVVPMWLGEKHSKEGGHSLPQHISHFTVDTLELLLKVTGFEPILMELTESSRALVDDKLKGKLQNIRCVARKV